MVTRRRFVKSSVGAAALAVSGSLVVSRPAGATAESMFAVATPGLRLRSGPGLRFSTLATLAMGTGVQFLAGAGRADGYDWANVKVVSSGKTGFVAFQFLAPIPSDGFQIGMMVHVRAAGGGNLRTGPGTGYRVITVVGRGTTGTISEGPVEANGYFWYKINFGDVRGWMATTVIAPGGGSDRAMVRVARGPVNVRRQPGTGGAIVATVPTGHTGYVTTDMPQEANGYTWVNVQFNDGIRGWVARNFLTWL